MYVSTSKDREGRVVSFLVSPRTEWERGGGSWRCGGVSLLSLVYKAGDIRIGNHSASLGSSEGLRCGRRSSLNSVNATQELPHATNLELTALALHSTHKALEHIINGGLVAARGERHQSTVLGLELA